MSFRRGLWAAALLIVAVVSGWLLWQRTRPVSEGSGYLRFAAIPFANLTGDPGLDWAGAVLPAAVIRQVQGLSGVHVFGAANANQAVALGATHLLEGYVAAGRGGVEVHYVLTAGPGRTLERSRLGSGLTADADGAVELASRVRSRLARNGGLLPLELSGGAALRHAGFALLETDQRARRDHWREAVEADPACGWCWEELAAHTLRLEGREAGLALLTGLRGRAIPIAGLAGRRLRLLEANIANKADERLAALEALSELTPGDPGALIPLAEALTSAQRCLEAASVYERAYQAEPGRSEVLNSLGYALAWAGRFDEALAALQRYEQAEPESANPRDSMGEVLMMAGRFAEAEEAFLASYELDPRFNGGAALQKAALVRWLNGDARQSGVLLERYLKQRAAEGDPFAALRRARWQYVFGQTAEALANLRQMASRPGAPASSLAASSLSLYLSQAGRLEEAAQLAAAARQQARDPLSLYAANVASAVSASEPAPRVDNDPNSRILQALWLTFHKEMSAAETAWREAMAAATPLNAALAREMLAQVQLARGDAPAAAETAGRAWPLLAHDHAFLLDFLVYPNLLCVRGAAAAEERQSDKARRYYDQFLRFTGSRPDPLGLVERARAATRL